MWLCPICKRPMAPDAFGCAHCSTPEGMGHKTVVRVAPPVQRGAVAPTPEQTIADALQHALALAYMEQAGMPEREAHETALEVIQRAGVGVGLLALDVANTVRRWGELPERTIYDARPGEESIAERARREAG